TPASPLTWAPLQDAADKVCELFNDYFLFNDPRIVYSVSSDGYQPALDALGGPATPRREDVMLVKTDESMLLRGAVSRTYTGRVWTDEAVNSRYLYADPTRQSRRSGAFDLDLLDQVRKLAHKVSAEVTFAGSGTSTLFVPQRLSSLTTRIDMPVYYNETGEVFLTRGVEPGDSYTFEGWLIDDDRAALVGAVNAAGGLLDSDWDAVRQAYTNLPGTIEADLYWLLIDITEDAETPIEKALAIRDYLRGGEFRYDIEGRYPESGRDFVSWFVLEEKRGYCTYYASAMAVMARLAGIPSRYAEGYRVISDGSGEILVTGEDAHAWAELYFNGIGWLTFDATPGEGGQAPDDRDNSGREPPASAPPPATPEPSPTPEATPEPSRAPNGPSGETATPEPTETPTPEPDSSVGDSPEPSDAPGAGPHNEPPEKPTDGPLRWLLLALGLILLILLLFIVMVLRRMRRSAPKFLAAREKDNRIKAIVWYRAILRLLARAGIAPEGGETPGMFAARAAASEDVPDGFIQLSRMIADMQYSPRTPDAKAAELGETVYGALLRRMTFRQRVDWTVDRTLHGIGDYTQIP
ncbi:MAG: transglutaminase domain-containing protein, partial [Clostridia bacterium]|nr:transglutaminase domain-containing protein [Clostridia bacterium]